MEPQLASAKKEWEKKLKRVSESVDRIEWHGKSSKV